MTGVHCVNLFIRSIRIPSMGFYPLIVMVTLACVLLIRRVDNIKIGINLIKEIIAIWK